MCKPLQSYHAVAMPKVTCVSRLSVALQLYIYIYMYTLCRCHHVDLHLRNLLIPVFVDVRWTCSEVSSDIS